MSIMKRRGCIGHHVVAAQRVGGRNQSPSPMFLSGGGPMDTADDARIQAVLFVSGGAKDGATVPILKERIAMGSLPDNDFVFDEPGGGRRHEEIFRADSGYQVRDLADSNSTFVNSHSIGQTEHVPQNGDEIRLAKSSVSLVFRYVQRDVPEGHRVPHGDIDHDLSSFLEELREKPEQVDQPPPNDQMYEGPVRLLAARPRII